MWHCVCCQTAQSDSIMSKALRILHLEDDPDYADLVRSLLAQEGIEAEVTLVSTQAEFEAALAQGKYDLVLADYLLPNYNGVDALRSARQKHPQMPFLL